MDDPLLVGVLQGGAELLAELNDFLPRQPAPAAEPVLQRLALDELHGEKRSALVPAGGVEADDIGVLELFEDGGLALEAGLGTFTLQDAGQHHLDGDRQPGFRVGSAVDGAHGPAAELFLNEERPDVLAD